MQLENSFSVPVPVDEAWRVLLDFERTASCMPGATLESATDDAVTGRLKVKLGPINLTYQGTATVTEKDEAAHRAVIDARGKDQRGNGTAAASITATLAAEGSGTRVDVLTDLTITGRPAQFGRGVMTDVGNKLLGQFADRLGAQLGGGTTTATPGPVAKAAATATGAVEEIAASAEQVPGDGAATTAVKKAAAATKKAAAGATEKVTAATEKSTEKSTEKPAKKAAPAKETTPAKKATPARKTTPAKKAAPAKTPAKTPATKPVGPTAPPARPATGGPDRTVPAAVPATMPATVARPATPARPEPIDLLEVTTRPASRYAPALGVAAAVAAVVLVVRRRRRRRARA